MLETKWIRIYADLDSQLWLDLIATWFIFFFLPNIKYSQLILLLLSEELQLGRWPTETFPSPYSGSPSSCGQLVNDELFYLPLASAGSFQKGQRESAQIAPLCLEKKLTFWIINTSQHVTFDKWKSWSLLAPSGLTSCRKKWKLKSVLRSRNYLFSAAAPFWLHFCP